MARSTAPTGWTGRRCSSRLYKLAVLGGDRGVRVLGAVAALALVAAVALVARAVAGARAGLIAGLLAALMSGSLALASVYTPGELLAAVPSTLVGPLPRPRASPAPDAAGCSRRACSRSPPLLVKQSFLDAGLAGVVFVVASGLADREVRVRWPLAYAAGVAIPVAALLAWQVAARLPDGGFVYALVGFRIDAPARALRLEHPAARAAEVARGARDRLRLALVIGLALIGLPRLRGDRVLLATIGAWLVGATRRRARRRQLLAALPDRARAGRLRRRRRRDRRPPGARPASWPSAPAPPSR